MGCWGATRECLRNCCGGPRSENYDAWLARERLRQLNHQTQRSDQLNRQNVQLEMALMQTQDILTSYRDLDRYDSAAPEGSMSMTDLQTGNLPQPSYASAPAKPTRSTSVRSQARSASSLDMRTQSTSLDALPSTPSISRDQIRYGSQPRSRPTQGSAPTVARHMGGPSAARQNAPVADASPVPPAARAIGRVPGNLPPLMESPAVGIVPVPSQATIDLRPPPLAATTTQDGTAGGAAPVKTRQQIIQELKRSMPNVPTVKYESSGPFAAPAVQAGEAYARTHDYRPS